MKTTPHSSFGPDSLRTRRAIAALLLLLACTFASFAQTSSSPCPRRETGLSCTTFMATDGTRVLFGDSEDAGMTHPLAGSPTETIVFFREGSGTDYGRMHLGWLWQGEYVSVQAGMNDQGLAYALTSVPETWMTPHPERPFTHGQDSFYDRILRRAATVEEAIRETLQFDFASCWFQIQYADASGQSAILSPGDDGEFVITRRVPDEGCLVASTFNIAEPDRYIGRDSFRRHAQATEALKRASEGSLSHEAFAEALQAVSRRGPYALNRSYTMYSTLYDLTNLTATVTVLSLYDAPLSIDLREELQLGTYHIALSEWVPTVRLRAAVRRYWATQICGFSLLALVLGVLTALAWEALPQS